MYNTGSPKCDICVVRLLCTKCSDPLYSLNNLKKIIYSLKKQLTSDIKFCAH